MRSHAAVAKKRSRLHKVLDALDDGSVKTTAELQQKTGSMAIHSEVHELRCGGHNISPAIYLGMRNNKKIYGYRLEKQPLFQGV